MNKKHCVVSVCLSLLLILVGCSDGSTPPQEAVRNVTSVPGTMDRTVLPIPDPVFPKITELDARKATAPPPFSIKAPEDAPNIVIVLIDDIGFGAADGFGGAIQTPTLDRLAADGLRFNQHNGLPVSFVADTYVQLLSVAEPEPNVAVGSPDEPFATMGGTDLIKAIALEENEESVLTYGCAPPGQS